MKKVINILKFENKRLINLIGEKEREIQSMHSMIEVYKAIPDISNNYIEKKMELIAERNELLVKAEYLEYIKGILYEMWSMQKRRGFDFVGQFIFVYKVFKKNAVSKMWKVLIYRQENECASMQV